MSISRREFLETSAAAAAGVTLPGLVPRVSSHSPLEEHRARTIEPSAGRPVVISAANGMRSRDVSGRPAIQVAYDMIVAGTDPLEAVVAGVQVVELDPNDQSVGLGGLPNEDGVVQLDASVMHGPTKRAGAVGALEDIATAAAVAKAVMDHTDHIFLVGAGAKRFALEMGFKEQNLLTEQSRQDWLRWKSHQDPYGNWLDSRPDSTSMPEHRVTPARTPPLDGAEREPDDRVAGSAGHVWYDARGVPHTDGTINMDAVDASGNIASVTTTSGLSWKIPGRVGDSPIIGAGQYCDNTVGAAGSTGRGEANMKVCGAFLAVEYMRQGMSPEAALMKVMERVVAMTEQRLLDDRGRPYFDLNYYALAKDGRVAGASAYEGSSYAVCDADGPRLVRCAYLWKREERPKGRPISGTLLKR